MRGNLVRRTWSYDPALYAPPRYRRTCHYDAGRTKPAVNNAISELVDAGVLIPVSQSRRNRAWEGSRLLELVVEMEGGRSPG
jgi:hypothetical protein